MEKKTFARDLAEFALDYSFPSAGAAVEDYVEAMIDDIGGVFKVEINDKEAAHLAGLLGEFVDGNLVDEANQIMREENMNARETLEAIRDGRRSAYGA